MQGFSLGRRHQTENVFVFIVPSRASLTISGRSSRTQLEICGSHICVESFCRLLGMSRKRFYKLVNGEPDLRTKESGTRPTFCPKQAQVDEFFRDLYQSAAEPLAVGLHFSDELIVAWLLYCLFFQAVYYVTAIFSIWPARLCQRALETWKLKQASQRHSRIGVPFHHQSNLSSKIVAALCML